jgi:hypothetical protein
LRVDADDHLIKAADFSLTNACPMNGLVTARSALRPQAGQIAVGGNIWFAEIDLKGRFTANETKIRTYESNDLAVLGTIFIIWKMVVTEAFQNRQANLTN